MATVAEAGKDGATPGTAHAERPDDAHRPTGRVIPFRPGTDPAGSDRLRPARGLLLGLLISAALWAVAGAVIWFLS